MSPEELPGLPESRMSISPHTLGVQPDRVIGAGPRGRGLPRILPPGPAAAICTGEKDLPLAAPSVSMPTEEQMAKLRYAAMAEAVRRLIGGERIHAGKTS